MGVPPAELDITEDLVRALLHDQAPDLADRTLRRAAAGWDNEMWRLGNDLAVRVPRRALGAGLIEHEQRWLPRLAPGLPIAAPVPVLAGRPTSVSPWSWSVVPWFPGTTADRGEPIDEDGAADLGRTLRALHRPADEDAPHNPYRSVGLAQRPQGPAAILGREVPGLDALWERALAAPAATTRTWIHADLHVRNVIVRDRRPVALIDWGDLCAGDPAVDLGARFTVLDPEVVPAFDAAYGPIDPALDARSRGWAALFCAIVADAHREDDRAWAARAEAALVRLAATPAQRFSDES